MCADTPRKDPETGVHTTGHNWDGIEELDNPMPRWWLWSFYACIVFALGYSVAYPAWPLLNGATPGLLGFSTRGEVKEEIATFAEANADLVARLEAVELDPEVIRADADLYNYAVQGGAAVFRTWCAQCHGSGANGVQASGYPSLIDDDWLWGGSLEDIYLTVTHGIRNEDDPDARWSQMPAFGVDELLYEEEITQVVHYVRALSGQEHDAALAGPGEEVYLNNCAACHMDDGSGDPYQGAPNLADAVWLYGGDIDTLTHTVTYSRFGVMPSHLERLSEADRRAVAMYVHSRGGGE